MSFFRKFSVLTRLAETAPVSLQIRTWSPAIQSLDANGNLVSTIPMTSLGAKKLAASLRGGDHKKNISIDIYGHAAAALQVDLRHPDILGDFFKDTKKVFVGTGIDFDKVRSISSYISWFPKSSEFGGFSETSRVVDPMEKKRFLEASDQELRTVKERALHFLGREYLAQNSNMRSDLYMYGEPSPERIISFNDLDFNAILKECHHMLEGRVVGDQFVMDTTRDGATYFGIDMLRKHRAILSRVNQGKPMEREPIAAEHVCTTAVMRLLEAGLGSEMYQEIVEKVLKEKPGLSHGLPIVDLTHYIAKETELRAGLQLAKTMRHVA